MPERFRELHDRGFFVMPNPWDVGSAKLFAGLGFEAVATTSSGFAWTLFLELDATRRLERRPPADSSSTALTGRARREPRPAATSSTSIAVCPMLILSPTCSRRKLMGCPLTAVPLAEALSTTFHPSSSRSIWQW